MMRNAAEIAANTGCIVEIDKVTGNVRILPPGAARDPRADTGGNSCDQLFQGASD